MNAGTFVVSAALLVAIVAVIVYLVRSRRAGKSVGCDGCTGCSCGSGSSAKLFGEGAPGHKVGAGQASCPACAQAKTMVDQFDAQVGKRSQGAQATKATQAAQTAQDSKGV